MNPISALFTKIINSIKNTDKRILAGLGIVILVPLVFLTITLTKNSTNKPIADKQPSTSTVDDSEANLDKVTQSPDSSEPASQPGTSTTQSNATDKPTSSNQQGSSGYSPNHIQTQPAAPATAVLTGIQITAAKSDGSCVLMMNASVAASNSSATGEVRFNVTNAEVNPAQTNTYAELFYINQGQTKQISKSTGPLVTWPYVSSLQVSVSLVGSGGTTIGSPTGSTSATIACP